MLHKLTGSFLRGLLIVIPFAVTLYVVWLVFATIDGWINVEPLLNRQVPGAGFVLTLALITLVGFLATNFGTRWLFRRLDALFARVPLIKLLYTALKDLIGAFVGDGRRFDKPVLVSPGDHTDLLVLGFETRDDLADLGLPGYAAVYVPQSYNFAGNVVAVPRARIRELPTTAPQAMAFIVSGGVSGSRKPS